jgi:hypothetical protein
MFYRKAFMGSFLHTAGAAMGAVMAGIVSYNSPRFMSGARDLTIAPRSPPKKAKSRGVNTRRGWRDFAYEVNRDPNSREATRRRRQIAAGSLRVENGLVP